MSDVLVNTHKYKCTIDTMYHIVKLINYCGHLCKIQFLKAHPLIKLLVYIISSIICSIISSIIGSQITVCKIQSSPVYQLSNYWVNVHKLHVHVL